MAMYTFRFSIAGDQVENAITLNFTDREGNPTRSRPANLPILQCETCSALIPADGQTKHDFFHNMLDLAIKGIR
jgi:hypothetical protein